MALTEMAPVALIWGVNWTPDASPTLKGTNHDCNCVSVVTDGSSGTRVRRENGGGLPWVAA